jgi:hypothetical protein
VDLTSTPLTTREKTDSASFGGRCLGSRRPKAPAKPSPENGEKRSRKSFPGLCLSSFCVSAFSLCESRRLCYFIVSLCFSVSLLSAFPLLFAFPAFYGSVCFCSSGSRWSVGAFL